MVRGDSERPLDYPNQADPTQIFVLLYKHAVDYVVIGGIAVQVHGHSRSTMDVDIAVAATDVNLANLALALEEINAELRGVDADKLGIDVTDPIALRDGGNFTLTTELGDLDVFVDEVPGAPSYQLLSDRAITVELFGTPVPISGLDDLISMKVAAGRPRDLDDVAVLTDPEGS